MKEFIIGRAGNQLFKIEAEGVSAEHARVTIDDSGHWTLEDLKGEHGNGTYVRDDKGNFVRIIKCNINEQTIIRLADVGHNSFTFMAHHLLVEDPKDFSYEFNYVYKLAQDFKKREETLNQTIKRTRKKLQIFAAVVVIVLMALAYLLIDMFANSNSIWTKAPIIVIPVLVKLFFPSDTSKSDAMKKELQESKKLMLVCPNCQYPMSDYDLNNRRCRNCKAK